MGLECIGLGAGTRIHIATRFILQVIGLVDNGIGVFNSCCTVRTHSCSILMYHVSRITELPSRGC